MNMHTDSESRAILMRKLMTICPLCGKLIFGRDIDFSKLDNGKVASWPATYDHNHSHKDFGEHNLTIYIDANYAVRERLIAPQIR